MLSFLQSVTALIGLDKLSGETGRGKTLGSGRLSTVEQPRSDAVLRGASEQHHRGERRWGRFAARVVVLRRV
jgi:hypothetical protein